MFKQVLISVAEEMQKSGKITRVQLFRLRLRMVLPSIVAEVETAAISEVVASGQADASAIDWEKLRSFLEWFIPFLIELIGQFSE